MKCNVTCTEYDAKHFYFLSLQSVDFTKVNRGRRGFTTSPRSTLISTVCKPVCRVYVHLCTVAAQDQIWKPIYVNYAERQTEPYDSVR